MGSKNINCAVNHDNDGGIIRNPVKYQLIPKGVKKNCVKQIGVQIESALLDAVDKFTQDNNYTRRTVFEASLAAFLNTQGIRIG